MNQHHYDTVLEALTDLQKRGFVYDFNLIEDCIECADVERSLRPEEFEVVEAYRFEGDSNPDDNYIVFAIQSKDGLKGILVDAYGPYAESRSSELISLLHISDEAF